MSKPRKQEIRGNIADMGVQVIRSIRATIRAGKYSDRKGGAERLAEEVALRMLRDACHRSKISPLYIEVDSAG